MFNAFRTEEMNTMTANGYPHRKFRRRRKFRKFHKFRKFW